MTHRIEAKAYVRLPWARTSRRRTETGSEESRVPRREIDPRRSLAAAARPRLYSVTAVESL